MHTVQRPGVRVRAHHQPATLDDALALLADLGGRGRPIAGGTDLLLELARGARAGVEELVDLTRIPGLDTIAEEDGHLVLGPLVTHNDVLADPRVADRALPLAQACLELGAPPLRNRATVAGNVVTASPANDTISALLALGATVDVTSAAGTRRLPVADFVTGFRTTDLAPGELVTAVRVPAMGDGERGVFVKLGLRRAQAISVVHLAVVLRLDGGTVTGARIALGSVAPTVVRCGPAEEAVSGTALDDAAVDAAAAAAGAFVRPIDDVRATARYRAEQTAVMVRRALAALRDGRERDAWPARPALLHVRPPAGAGGAPRGTVTHAGDGDRVTAEVNGERVSAGGAVGRTLLDWLRDGAGLTGTKEGCAEGECGACTVVLDGRAVLACLVPAARAHGAAVRTVEGLDPHGRHPVQDAFVRAGAVQCGFCTPGFVVAGAALLDTCPSPSTEEIVRGLAGNLCRCTGYYSIVDAMAEAAAGGGAAS